MKNVPVRVLCVGVDAMALMSRRLMLERLGCHVLVASSGTAALAMVEEHAVDVVVTEDLMSDMSTTDLIAAIRLFDSTIPVMILISEPFAPPELADADFALLKSGDRQKFLNVVAKLALDGRRGFKPNS